MLPNAHQRKQIRDVVKSVLTDETSAEKNVFVNQYLSLPQEKLPAICIYTGKEQSDIFNNQMLKRTLTLSIEIHTSKNSQDGMVEELELIAAECEQALFQHEDLDGNCDQLTLVSTDIAVKNDADELIGAALMSYNVVYYTTTAVDTPDNPLTQTDIAYENNTKGKVILPTGEN